MMYYVYLYFDPIRSEPIYVGFGSKNRAWDHLKRKDNHPFTNRIQVILKAGFNPMISIVRDSLSKEEAKVFEIELIKQYGRKDKGLGPLLNLTDGGEGYSGRIVSEETKLKISLAKRGKKLSPEHVDAMSKALVGRKRPAISLAKKGKKNSQSHNEAISKSTKGKPKPWLMKNL